MNKSLVSVFMPTYNHEAFVAEAIESVLAQSYPNFQLVIGDDCSQDGTWPIVMHYQQAHPQRIIAYRNEQNLGISGNCSKLLNLCRGDYVAFHAGDDLWLPEKLARQVSVMDADTFCALSYHDLEVFDSESGATLFYWNNGPGRPAPVVGAADVVARKVVENFAGFFGALSVMIRRACLDEDLGYDPRLPYQGEMLIWLNALRNPQHTVAFIPASLARYRKHPQGVSQQNNRTQEDIFFAIVENEIPGYANAVRRARGKRYYSRGVDSVLAGEGRQALEHFHQCIRYHPHSPKLIYWIMRALILIPRQR